MEKNENNIKVKQSPRKLNCCNFIKHCLWSSCEIKVMMGLGPWLNQQLNNEVMLVQTIYQIILALWTIGFLHQPETKLAVIHPKEQSWRWLLVVKSCAWPGQKGVWHVHVCWAAALVTPGGQREIPLVPNPVQPGSWVVDTELSSCPDLSLSTPIPMRIF